jgi:hypothetical protein
MWIDRDTFACPEREKAGVVPDFWTNNEQCTYCGSITYDAFIAKLDILTVGYDGVKKIFMFDDGSKFHFKHADEHQREILQLLYKEGKMRIKRNAK